MSSSRDLWVTNPKPNPKARLRLFCLPYAGAGAQTFRPWADLLSPDIEVCPIQLPGRETRFREAPLTDCASLVRTLTGVLYPYHVDRRFALFGHSMGAVVAFELARSLVENYGVMPVHLFVSARIAPQERDPRPAIHSLPEDKFADVLRSLNGTPEDVLTNPELRPVLSMLRADFALNERYAYVEKPPLNLPLSVYGGLRDPKVTEPELRAWQTQTAGRFELRMFEGDHFFINTARPEVLRTLSDELRSAI